MEENIAWEVTYNNNEACVLKNVHDCYYAGFKKLDYKKNEKPSVDYINEKLAVAGWTLKTFKRMTITSSNWFSSIVNYQFPVTTIMRSLNSSTFAEEPDCFHDYFGHLPFLFDQSYVDLLIKLSNVYLLCEDDESRELVYKVYYYIFEFGVYLQEGKVKLLGSGFLSSFEQRERVLNGDINIKKFNVEQISLESIHKDGVVNTVFVLPPFDELDAEVEKLKLSVCTVSCY
ncbi:hypothetical protein [Pseudoalteromonas umbrosa]|uniref:hypothetical protein n=1 Tax=Pseudoalteromonas umbrosa TaxID=3048489 RepID=UPI0024C33625|nr:hypothetical protein [Pseudoalteromonas sp. B95]MDK1286998.1 hypothetical protein [Pseudoalteromonas sp. B95]